MTKMKVRMCKMNQVEAINYIRAFILSFFVFTISGCSNIIKDFRFENCGNWEQCTKALYKLHPIGSDYRDLIKTLNAAGAKCYTQKEIEENNLRVTGKKMNSSSLGDTKFTICTYSYLEFPITSIRCNVRIYFAKDRNITKIAVSFGATSF